MRKELVELEFDYNPEFLNELINLDDQTEEDVLSIVKWTNGKYYLTLDVEISFKDSLSEEVIDSIEMVTSFGQKQLSKELFNVCDLAFQNKYEGELFEY